ncbi:hypothetical protein EN871_18285 [bacterium M00.F.Ca.ET.228.01.1.1]|uniref:Uncharacterized protein n=1 Tax=Burkholderia sp. (strain CCGE1003) TaxID=640512 RepID=E1T7D2_BURSG|nr:hypothetical protein [Paraburkholderia phenoliruptrix]MBW9130595.1 hypothetical protein [Paraburkholderia ginsengiterrae]TGP42871.1 hypothetical protein EN871_18285 [bacterium M00.F.Ca.ET.228.01.1.1]TGR99062.1 hypothetical protein EN834_20925 [bacterium M00.F.Ca.ET.191.01.1.1]TGU03374.1 hypothetical protein EN798_21745 [bacterium M00.F.Ca.ET.155.01.1.1]
MKGGVWPNVRLSVIALAVAGTLAGTLGPTLAHAQPSADRAASERASRSSNLKPNRRSSNSERPASDVMLRTAVPPDLDQRRRDGHMTPDERRLLRQHIEDAVRELYKR